VAALRDVAEVLRTDRDGTVRLHVENGVIRVERDVGDPGDRAGHADAGP
jgi:hypothetical protein